MAKTVFKYQLFVSDKPQNLILPKGAEILSVQLQGTRPTLWAMVDDREEEKVERRIHTFGTGWVIETEAELNFLATLQMPRGLVFHFFEEIQ